MHEHIDLGMLREMEIAIDNNVTRLHIVDKSDPSAIAITVDNATNKEQIAHAATFALKQRYWFADPQWEHEIMKERFAVEIGGRTVEVFAFGESLQQEVRTGIIQTLEHFYNALNDKSLWNLESIQILPHQTINLKSGGPIRGMESPTQRRLELYPAGIANSAYRNGELLCTDLEGTLTHEITHIVLETTLAKAWNSKDLGWEIIDDGYFIELPGGHRTPYFNKRPRECPTSYGALLPDDDRAESVVAYLFSRETLHESRRSILENIFIDTDAPITAKTHILPLVLPKLPSTIPITVSESQKNLFGTIGAIRRNTTRIISLAEFRRTHSL